MALHAYGLTASAPSAAVAHALDAKYKRELVDGPVITLPMRDFHITFNPRDVETLAPYGTVYHALSVSAPWGSVTVRGGDALISTDFRSLRVAAPRNPGGSVATGHGWKLQLAPRCAIEPDPHRPGSYIVVG
jgi:hypothetical protein